MITNSEGSGRVSMNQSVYDRDDWYDEHVQTDDVPIDDDFTVAAGLIEEYA